MDLPDLNDPEAIRKFLASQQIKSKPQLTSLQKRTRYGKHTERVDELLEEQHWTCYVCDTSLREAYYPDINKDTIQCQAILCWSCNQALGTILSLQNNLESMLEYINHQREASYVASILDF